MKKIYLAGGCFWGLEAYMSKITGVIDAVSGYGNGKTPNPTYEQVCREDTGYAETVKVDYNEGIIDLENLLAYYFRVIDPTTINRQGGDIGSQYRTGIFYTDQEDEAIIKAYVLLKQKEYALPIQVIVEPLTTFYEAEEYHQDYLEKNPTGYCHINVGLALEPIIDPNRYKKPEQQVLKQQLTELQFAVTQETGTEKPFSNPYWDHFHEGIYVDITTGEPLFSSNDKFESQCGWPSFSKAISKDVIFEIEDNSHFMSRTEVRSRVGNAHLGHVFNDGPSATGGLRYCINSAALEFISLDEMEQKGYEFLKKMLFPHVG